MTMWWDTWVSPSHNKSSGKYKELNQIQVADKYRKLKIPKALCSNCISSISKGPFSEVSSTFHSNSRLTESTLWPQRLDHISLSRLLLVYWKYNQLVCKFFFSICPLAKQTSLQFQAVNRYLFHIWIDLYGYLGSKQNSNSQ